MLIDSFKNEEFCIKNEQFLYENRCILQAMRATNDRGLTLSHFVRLYIQMKIFLLKTTI